ncbi:hypothetical protein K1W54_06910, partial [Micromonospora sp. CPCC 205371]|nr:hypothetical protein [Micromonospora sp. CPCC 205371]
MANLTFRSLDASETPEELAKALQPMIVKWETAALKVAAAHDPQRPQRWKQGSVEQLLSQRFNQLPDIVKTRAESKADAVLTSARFPRRAERLLGVDVKDVDTTPAVAPPPRLTPDELNSLIAFTKSLVPTAAQAAPAAGPA